MACRGLLKSGLIVLVIACTAQTAAALGPGEAAARSQPGRATRQAARHADFKVLVWYSRTDPLGTFKYQIYDVRKGEYTPAVDAWLRDLRTKYPSYGAVVRDVDLTREKGKTEKLKVGSVIQRELTVAAAMSGVVLGGSVEFGLGPRVPAQNRAIGISRQPGSPAGDRSFLNTSPPPFPVPVPYPRPHP